MKFQLISPDHDYSVGLVSGGINGGTVWLHNMADNLRALGHDVEVVPIRYKVDGDFVIVQSESMANCPSLDNFVGRGGKLITLLGHFKDHRDYMRLKDVMAQSSYMFTPWEGELLNGIEAVTLPHGYNNLIDDGKSMNRKGSIIFSGNTYNLRSESYFNGLDITKINAVLPKELPAIYRAADVCVNIHGDFQKNIVSPETNRLSDSSGMMINERFWFVLGSGGLLVTDWVSQMANWFSKDELITAETPEEFTELVNYYKNHKQEGLKKLEKAREKVQSEHTYKKRMELMLTYL